MAKTARISYFQMMILLLTTRIFVSMTYVPLIGRGYNFSTQIFATIISIVILSILIIPIVLLNKIKPNETITHIIMRKSKPFGYISSILYLAFFLFYTINLIMSYVNFVTARFFPDLNKIVILALILLVSGYCAYCGVEGISRSGVIIFALFIVVFLIMIFSARKSISSINFYSGMFGDNLYEAVTSELMRNGEIIGGLFLIKYVKTKAKCGLYLLLAAKLILLELMTYIIVGTLGDYVKLTEYPFLTLGSFASGIFGRYDSQYLILWTMTAVISIALFLNILANLLKEITPKLRYKNIAICSAIFLAVFAVITFGEDVNIAEKYILNEYFLVVLLFVIPFIMLLIEKKGGKNETNKLY